ncbi:hypothetical protein RBG61_06445 [Paludicola sp. MB14-C6]|uniref:hypothetical protein n=1 Tax=Paludihabitans sp. MB14-C6 TaxID=3070656 RepID=UPI0027DE0DFC|nr:hypothetical protein [Paludicola sp. MB14-C6]WMJ24300.1 hypothetical protein RBG61_06445 [Paludicola sp. MB14-C6]
MDLFIPTKINKDEKFAKGFGKKEFKRLIVTIAVTLISSFTISILATRSLQLAAIIAVSICVFVGGISYFLFVRVANNLSVYNYIQLTIKFIREQQFYRYKKLKEWK